MEMNDQALKQFDFRGASVRTVMIKGGALVGRRGRLRGAGN
jgi:prophage antirepressor-like protein